MQASEGPTTKKRWKQARGDGGPKGEAQVVSLSENLLSTSNTEPGTPPARAFILVRKE